MTRIFHLAQRKAWEAAQRLGDYRPPSLESEGYIHCSPADRVDEVAQAFFGGQDDLMLLEIDSVLLTSKLVYEKAADRGGLFPHIYGSLNLGAVVATVDYPSGDPAPTA
ncbi:MAG: DUF952 domain-containing protein [Anaerolineales bacterium]